MITISQHIFADNFNVWKLVGNQSDRAFNLRLVV